VLTTLPHIELIGSLTSLSTVHQACLNVKEVVKGTAEALSVGQFRHGN
jgi:fructoselysine-6-P-deglycase FrlB-like protein